MPAIKNSEPANIISKICKTTLIFAVVSMNVLIPGCVCKERILNTATINLGSVNVTSSPKGKVYLDGKYIGSSPVIVPLTVIRHEVERKTYKPGPNIDDAIIVGGPVTAIFPPAGLLVFLTYATDEGFVKEERKVFWRDDIVTHTLEVRHPEYKTARKKFKSNQANESWKPVLELTSLAKAKKERERKALELSQKKKAQEEKECQNIINITKVSDNVSGEMQQANIVLKEIVNKSIETQKSLLNKQW